MLDTSTYREDCNAINSSQHCLHNIYPRATSVAAAQLYTCVRGANFCVDDALQSCNQEKKCIVNLTILMKTVAEVVFF